MSNKQIVYIIEYKVDAFSDETGIGEVLDKMRELGEAEVLDVTLEEVKAAKK